jgi:hypothetical protein
MSVTSNPTTDPVQAMLAQTALKNLLFAANSRYYGINTTTMTDSQDRITIYLRRRFLPSPSLFQLLQEHTVIQGERLDNIAAQYLSDPTLFWQICDANNAMRADDLTATVGRKLAITMPQGITGTAL